MIRGALLGASDHASRRLLIERIFPHSTQIFAHCVRVAIWALVPSYVCGALLGALAIKPHREPRQISQYAESDRNNQQHNACDGVPFGRKRLFIPFGKGVGCKPYKPDRGNKQKHRIGWIVPKCLDRLKSQQGQRCTRYTAARAQKSGNCADDAGREKPYDISDAARCR